MARIGICGYILGNSKEFGTQKFLNDPQNIVSTYALQSIVVRNDTANYPTLTNTYSLNAFGHTPGGLPFSATHVINTPDEFGRHRPKNTPKWFARFYLNTKPTTSNTQSQFFAQTAKPEEFISQSAQIGDIGGVDTGPAQYETLDITVENANDGYNFGNRLNLFTAINKWNNNNDFILTTFWLDGPPDAFNQVSCGMSVYSYQSNTEVIINQRFKISYSLWYRIELGYDGHDTILKVNGDEVGRIENSQYFENNQSEFLINTYTKYPNLYNKLDVYIDDIVIDNESFPGPGYIHHVVPCEDVTKTGWTTRNLSADYVWEVDYGVHTVGMNGEDEYPPINGHKVSKWYSRENVLLQQNNNVNRPTYYLLADGTKYIEFPGTVGSSFSLVDTSTKLCNEFDNLPSLTFGIALRNPGIRVGYRNIGYMGFFAAAAYPSLQNQSAIPQWRVGGEPPYSGTGFIVTTTYDLYNITGGETTFFGTFSTTAASKTVAAPSTAKVYVNGVLNNSLTANATRPITLNIPSFSVCPTLDINNSLTRQVYGVYLYKTALTDESVLATHYDISSRFFKSTQSDNSASLALRREESGIVSSQIASADLEVKLSNNSNKFNIKNSSVLNIKDGFISSVCFIGTVKTDNTNSQYIDYTTNTAYNSGLIIDGAPWPDTNDSWSENFINWQEWNIRKDFTFNTKLTDQTTDGLTYTGYAPSGNWTGIQKLTTNTTSIITSDNINQLIVKLSLEPNYTTTTNENLAPPITYYNTAVAAVDISSGINTGTFYTKVTSTSASMLKTRKSEFKTYSLILNSYTKTTRTSTLLKYSPLRISSLSGLLKKTYFTSNPTNTLIYRTSFKNSGVFSVLKAGRPRTLQANTLFKGTNNKITSINTIVSSISIKNQYIFSLLRKNPSREQRISNLLKSSIIKSNPTSSLLKKTITLSNNVNYYLKSNTIKLNFLNSLLKSSTGKTNLANALFKIKIALSNNVYYLLKSSTRRTNFANSLLKTGTYKTSFAIAILKKTITFYNYINSLLKSSIGKTNFTNSLLRSSLSKTNPTVSSLKKTILLSNYTNLLIRNSVNKTHRATAFMKSNVNIIIRAFTLLKSRNIKTLSTNFYAQVSTYSPQYSNSSLKALKSASFITSTVTAISNNRIMKIHSLLRSSKTILNKLTTLFKAASTKAILSNSLLRTSKTVNQSIKVLLLSIYSKTYRLSSFLRASIRKTQSVNSLLRASSAKISSLSILLKVASADIHNLNFLLKVSNKKTFSLNAAFKYTGQKIALINSLLKSLNTRATYANILLRRGITVSASILSSLRALSQKANYTTSLFKNTNTITQKAILLLKFSGIRTSKTSSLLKSSYSKLHTIASYLRQSTPKNLTMSGLLKSNVLRISYNSSWLKTRSTKSYGSNTILKSSLVLFFKSSILLRATSIKNTFANTLLKSRTGKSNIIGSLLKRTITLSNYTISLLKSSTRRTIFAYSLLRSSIGKANIIASLLKSVKTITIKNTALLKGQTSKTNNILSLFKGTYTKAILIGALLRQYSIKTIKANALLRSQTLKITKSTGLLLFSKSINSLLNSLLRIATPKSNFTNSSLRLPNAKVFIANSLLKAGKTLIFISNSLFRLSSSKSQFSTVLLRITGIKNQRSYALFKSSKSLNYNIVTLFKAIYYRSSSTNTLYRAFNFLFSKSSIFLRATSVRSFSFVGLLRRSNFLIQDSSILLRLRSTISAKAIALLKYARPINIKSITLLRKANQSSHLTRSLLSLRSLVLSSMQGVLRSSSILSSISRSLLIGIFFKNQYALMLLRSLRSLSTRSSTLLRSSIFIIYRSTSLFKFTGRKINVVRTLFKSISSDIHITLTILKLAAAVSWTSNSLFMKTGIVTQDLRGLIRSSGFASNNSNSILKSQSQNPIKTSALLKAFDTAAQNTNILAIAEANNTHLANAELIIFLGREHFNNLLMFNEFFTSHNSGAVFAASGTAKSTANTRITYLRNLSSTAYGTFAGPVINTHTAESKFYLTGGTHTTESEFYTLGEKKITSGIALWRMLYADSIDTFKNLENPSVGNVFFTKNRNLRDVFTFNRIILKTNGWGTRESLNETVVEANPAPLQNNINTIQVAVVSAGVKPSARTRIEKRVLPKARNNATFG